MTGEPVDAAWASEHGLVNRLTDDGEALQTALQLAELVARNAPMAVVTSKRIARQAFDWSESDAFSRQQAMTDAVFASDDAAEGASAFAEKRAPHWTGR
jgi:enoyl-CoA hydratase